MGIDMQLFVARVGKLFHVALWHRRLGTCRLEGYWGGSLFPCRACAIGLCASVCARSGDLPISGNLGLVLHWLCVAASCGWDGCCWFCD